MTISTTTDLRSHGTLLGVNISGGEYGKPGDKYYYGYIYPSHAELDYYASKGMEVIRMPFKWERIQTTKFGALDQNELKKMDDVVNYAHTKGLEVVLDLHGFGKGWGSAVGSSATPNAAFSDFWGKMASHFASHPNVMYGLMNEPNTQTPEGWLSSVNGAISAIRAHGAHQTVLVPGTHWDGASTWTTNGNAKVIGEGVKDPAHNYAFEVHQYFDKWSTGMTTQVESTTIGADRLKTITDWATAKHQQLFLGEFGVATDVTSMKALDKMLAYMTQHQDVWKGATYWAGGPWWGNYAFSIEPHNGVDAKQMSVMHHYADLMG